METSIKITLIIVAGILILGLLGYSFFMNLSPMQTISSSGQSQIKAVPDVVGIYFSIENTANSAEEAKQKTDGIADSLITNLIKEGFERKEIQTQQYNVNPIYDWTNGKQKITGYQAVHSIRLEFPASETEKIGRVLDIGVSSGAGISYINFELSVDKQNEYKVQALKQATEDARIKAEAIASGLNKKLGSIYSVSSSGFDYYPWRMYDMISGANLAEAKTATADIQPSEQDINAYVTVSYKIR